METDPVLTITDIMCAGVCPAGIVSWCKSNNFEYRKIKAGAYRLSDIENLNDGYAQLVARYVRDRAEAA